MGNFESQIGSNAKVWYDIMVWMDRYSYVQDWNDKSIKKEGDRGIFQNINKTMVSEGQCHEAYIEVCYMTDHLKENEMGMSSHKIETYDSKRGMNIHQCII